MSIGLPTDSGELKAEGFFMTATRAAAYSGGGLLLVAWLAYAGVEREPQPVQDAPKAVETSGTETLASDVQAQAERLKTRLAAAPTLQPTARNPFAFTVHERETPRERHAPPVETAVAPEAPPPPVEPAIELVGMATNHTADGLVRTAVISALSGELFLVKEGEMIATRYKVASVAADTAELTDLLTGATRRLTLKN
jgi:hypothetical protein